MYLCRAWHDGNICTRIANNTFCAVGILVFLSLLASFAGVVAAVLFGQVYSRVSRQGWSYPAQAHINYSFDGYDGGYLYDLLYKNATHPNHRLGSGCNRLCRCWLYRAKGKGVGVDHASRASMCLKKVCECSMGFQWLLGRLQTAFKLTAGYATTS